MTSQERAIVVEVLRCAADQEMWPVQAAQAVGLDRFADANVIALAYKAWYETGGRFTNASRLPWYVASALEAAQLVEEGSWP